MKFSNYNSGIKFLLATNGLILAASAMLWPIYALFVEDMWWDLMDASLAGFFFAMTAGVVVLLSGKKVDQVERKERIVALGYFLMWWGFFAYIFTGSIVQLFLVQILIGIWEAVYSPAFDAIYSLHLDDDHEWEERGTREAMNYIVWWLWALLWWWLVTRWWFDALFVGMGCLCMVSVFLSLRYGKKYLKTN